MFYSVRMCSFPCSSDSGQTGQWSTDGCRVVSRRSENDHDYVTCECDHLTSFGVLMDQSSVEVNNCPILFILINIYLFNYLLIVHLTVL